MDAAAMPFLSTINIAVLQWLCRNKESYTLATHLGYASATHIGYTLA